MSKKLRQYFGLLSAIAAYYLIHEGAHLLYALFIGTFRQVRFTGLLGMQIDVYAEAMSSVQMGVFCLVASIATAVAAYLLTACSNRLVHHPSAAFKACMYYITLALLFIDPLYLSILCGFFGGGDMNGIALLLPEAVARIIYGCILAVHAVLFFRIILPKYKAAFQ